MKPDHPPHRTSLRRILLVGFVIVLAASAVYWLLAVHILAAGMEPPPLDRQVKEVLHAHAQQHPAPRATLFGITQLGSTQFLGGLALAVAVILWLKDQRILALIALLGIAGSGLFNIMLKGYFQRARPAFDDGAFVREGYYSFASGHSMGATVAYGLLAYLLWLILPQRWQRLLAVAVLAVLVLAIGFSRVYLGAHYLSDVLAGFALGIAWVTVWIMGIEIIRRLQHREPVPAETPSNRRDDRAKRP